MTLRAVGHQPHLDVRRAVRAALRDVAGQQQSPSPCVLVACSGGADSLSLAAATVHEAVRSDVRAGGLVVDHGLQDGSAQRARAVADALAKLGLDPVETVHVRGSGGVEGPEGNARRARYSALDAAARRHGAAAVLLGHTLDDQAETVLLGLARGSGARSLAGMAARHGIYWRPLLALPRSVVRAAVPDGLHPWEDPHNTDPTYARSRVRHRVLPLLERELGPGIAAALARTADLLRDDADALDGHAVSARLAAMIERRPSSAKRGVHSGGSVLEQDQTTDDPPEVGYDVEMLADLPRAVRWRALRAAATAAGCPATDLTAAHVGAVDTLVTAWRGQKGIDLPGPVRAVRRAGILAFQPGDR